MEEFWYCAKLCYEDTDSFTIYIKTDNIYRDIAEHVENRFTTSNYEIESNSIDRLSAKGKNKKVIELMKDQIGGKTTKTS